MRRGHRSGINNSKLDNAVRAIKKKKKKGTQIVWWWEVPCHGMCMWLWWPPASAVRPCEGDEEVPTREGESLTPPRP